MGQIWKDAGFRREMEWQIIVRLLNNIACRNVAEFRKEASECTDKTEGNSVKSQVSEVERKKNRGEEKVRVIILQSFHSQLQNVRHRCKQKAGRFNLMKTLINSESRSLSDATPVLTCVNSASCTRWNRSMYRNITRYECSKAGVGGNAARISREKKKGPYLLNTDGTNNMLTQTYQILQSVQSLELEFFITSLFEWNWKDQSLSCRLRLLRTQKWKIECVCVRERICMHVCVPEAKTFWSLSWEE